MDEEEKKKLGWEVAEEKVTGGPWVACGGGRGRSSFRLEELVNYLVGDDALSM